MNISETQLTQDDITNYWAMAQEVISKWSIAKSTSALSEIDAYREELVQAKQGISTIEDYCENQVSEWKKKLGAVKLMRRNLDNHIDMAKNRYWLLRKDMQDSLVS